MMRASVEGVRDGRAVYRRAGRPCPRCGERSARAGGATTTGSHTGARAASQEERTEAGRKERGVAVRSPRLRVSLRAFCLGAIAYLSREVEAGSEIPFAFDGHGSPGRPTCTSTARLSGSSVAARVGRIAALPDAHSALEELRREPAAAIFARAHAPGRRRPAGGVRPAASAGGDRRGGGGAAWDDAAFERAYAELERSMFGSGSTPPLRPSSGCRSARPSTSGTASGSGRRRPASSRLSARTLRRSHRAGSDAGDRLCVLELEHELATEGSSFPTRRAS